MTQRDEPERIEIELTSHESAGPQLAAPIDGAVGAESSETEGGVLDSERGRLVVAGSMIGLIALLLGFAVGRAGSGSESAGDALAPATSTDDAVSTTIDETLTTIEPPAPTTTERVRRTTTTRCPNRRRVRSRSLRCSPTSG